MKNIAQVFEVEDARVLATDLNMFSDDILDWFDTFKRNEEPIQFNKFMENNYLNS